MIACGNCVHGAHFQVVTVAYGDFRLVALNARDCQSSSELASAGLPPAQAKGKAASRCPMADYVCRQRMHKPKRRKTHFKPAAACSLSKLHYVLQLLLQMSRAWSPSWKGLWLRRCPSNICLFCSIHAQCMPLALRFLRTCSLVHVRVALQHVMLSQIQDLELLID